MTPSTLTTAICPAQIEIDMAVLVRRVTHGAVDLVNVNDLGS